MACQFNLLCLIIYTLVLFLFFSCVYRSVIPTPIHSCHLILQSPSAVTIHLRLNLLLIVSPTSPSEHKFIGFHVSSTDFSFYHPCYMFFFFFLSISSRFSCLSWAKFPLFYSGYITSSAASEFSYLNSTMPTWLPLVMFWLTSSTHFFCSQIFHLYAAHLFNNRKHLETLIHKRKTSVFHAQTHFSHLWQYLSSS